jgi:hypothetical protein
MLLFFSFMFFLLQNQRQEGGTGSMGGGRVGNSGKGEEAEKGG